MAMRITKPEVDLRGKLTQLDKPTGIAGEAMLRAETPQEQFNLIGAGRRNLIINGAMNVSQRGDFTTDGTQGFSTNDYTVDRWKINNGQAGTDFFQHVSTNQPNDLYGSKSIKMTVKATTATYRRLSQAIEDYQQFVSGRIITVSFYYKAQNASGNLRVGMWSNNFYQEIAKLPSTDVWVRKEITFSVNNTATSSYPADINFGFNTNIGASVAGVVGDFIEITGVQLELGKVATPFEHRSYGEELALCTRYFWRVTKETTYHNVTNVAAYSGSNAYGTLYFPVQMRAIPSFAHSGVTDFFVTGNNNNVTPTTVSADEMSKWNAQISVGEPSGFTQGYAYWFRFDSDAPSGQYFQFDAEL